MPKKKDFLNKHYRNKLIKLASFYEVKEIRKFIKSKRRLTNSQIELLLRKNNITLPLKGSSWGFYWNNFYKILTVTILIIGFFGILPYLLNYLNNNIIVSKTYSKKENYFNSKKELDKAINEFNNNLTSEIPKNILPQKKKKLNENSDLNIETQTNNYIRLSASTLNQLFNDTKYDLKEIRKNKKVKPIYISLLPSEMKKIQNTQERKDLFIKIVLPLILEENKKILLDRKKLFKILKKNYNTKTEKKWLEKKLKEYNLKNSEIPELKIRMDIIPVSLAIAQAAKETGWGTSRFAQEGNALYGQWTYSQDGMEPYDNETGSHKVMRFDLLKASVKAYKRNLNTHRSYNEFRKARANQRSKNEKLDSLLLVKYLDKYAETGKEYTVIISKIIKQNSLNDFDHVKLLPTKVKLKQNI